MPRRIRVPAGVRKRRKATVIIRRNPLLRFLPLIQRLLTGVKNRVLWVRWFEFTHRIKKIR